MTLRKVLADLAQTGRSDAHLLTQQLDQNHGSALTIGHLVDALSTGKWGFGQLYEVLWEQLHNGRRAVFRSAHSFKYRLACVVRGECVLRYDNEVGKGDHRHFGKKESSYVFTTPDQLIADFQKDIARWNHENSNS